jgi:hypothetical protein
LRIAAHFLLAPPYFVFNADSKPCLHCRRAVLVISSLRASENDSTTSIEQAAYRTVHSATLPN